MVVGKLWQKWRQTSGLFSFHTGKTNGQYSTLENHIDVLVVITCLISLLWGEKCEVISNSFELAVFSRKVTKRNVQFSLPAKEGF